MSPHARRKARIKANDEWLQAAWKEKGVKPPATQEKDLEDAEDAPELTWLEEQYLAMYDIASTCRPVAFGGPLPIPFSDVAAILDRNGYTGAYFDAAAYVIRALDIETLDLWAKEAEKTRHR